MRLRIGAFASHGGSNLQAIIDACAEGRINGEVCFVISNNSGSPALEKARKAGIPGFHLSAYVCGSEEKLDMEILKLLKKYDVSIITLCGYMKMLGAGVIEEYRDRILNIHPALLPKYGGKGMYGMNVHKAVIDGGETQSGVTIHLVNERYDEGRIINQKKVAVKPGDTPEKLAARVLEAEHVIYAETLDMISRGIIKL
jgi:phosphoribosylglycinamide formyltransferase 1